MRKHINCQVDGHYWPINDPHLVGGSDCKANCKNRLVTELQSGVQAIRKSKHLRRHVSLFFQALSTFIPNPITCPRCNSLGYEKLLLLINNKSLKTRQGRLFLHTYTEQPNKKTPLVVVLSCHHLHW